MYGFALSAYMDLMWLFERMGVLLNMGLIFGVNRPFCMFLYDIVVLLRIIYCQKSYP